MTPEELREIIKRQEGPKLDFKSKYDLDDKTVPEGVDQQKWDKYIKGRWNEFLKDIVSLANANPSPELAGMPGYLIIGAEDRKEKRLPDGGVTRRSRVTVKSMGYVLVCANL